MCPDRYGTHHFCMGCMNIKEAHKYAVQRVSALYDKDHANTVIWWLLEALAQQSRSQLIVADYNLSDEQQATLSTWLDEHINKHKPLAYIIGSIPFCEITIAVEPPILIPRPETEEWITSFIDELRAKKIHTFSLLDMCTGSGCIALALAHAFPRATIYAVDIDPHAIACARENARKNNITNVTFVQSDLFSALDDIRFDFILSNPPYIAYDEKLSLAASVREWESPQALFAQDEGYALIKKIIAQAPAYLTSDTLHNSLSNLSIEIGYRQGPLVSAYMKEHGYSNVYIQKDYASHDRIVSGRYTNGKTSSHNE